jgi:mono/diheme cytochrome c family protein
MRSTLISSLILALVIAVAASCAVPDLDGAAPAGDEIVRAPHAPPGPPSSGATNDGGVAPSGASSGPTGDPTKGYDFLVNGSYIGCGIPLGVIQRTEPLLRLLYGNLFREDIVTDNPGIPGRTGLNAKIDYALTAFQTKRGVVAVEFNCLSCHAEKINGQVIVGLGNTTRDFTVDLMALAGQARIAVQGSEELAEWTAWKSRVAGMAPSARAETLGVNPAVNITYALFAHRDPVTLAWSESPLLAPPPPRFPPVDVPAWWHMAKRKTMFASSELPKHHHIMMLASMLCTEDVASAAALDAPFNDVEAYIETLKPPPFPRQLDASLVATGKPIFEATCASCHGTYGPGGTYTEQLIPMATIGTDPALANQQGSSSARFYGWLAQSPYGQGLAPHVDPAYGYIAPPLDGVWATAPYFHNGSVPTLEAVLDPTKRPKAWERSFDSHDYDVNAPGWKYEAQSTGDDDEHVYDTTRFGSSKAGHTFGSTLSAAQRRALIEYLKSL